MSGALKHKQRSHKTYSKNVNAAVFGNFERKAKVRKIKTENKSFFGKIKEKLFKKQSR